MAEDQQKAAEARARRAQEKAATEGQPQEKEVAAAENREAMGPVTVSSGPASEDWGAEHDAFMRGVNVDSILGAQRTRTEDQRDHEPPARTTAQMFHDSPPEIAPRRPRQNPDTYLVYKDGGQAHSATGEYLTLVVGENITVTLQRNVPTPVSTGLADLLEEAAKDSDGAYSFERVGEAEYQAAKKLPEAQGQ